MVHCSSKSFIPGVEFMNIVYACTPVQRARRAHCFLSAARGWNSTLDEITSSSGALIAGGCPQSHSQLGTYQNLSNLQECVIDLCSALTAGISSVREPLDARPSFLKLGSVFSWCSFAKTSCYAIADVAPWKDVLSLGP